MDQMDNENEYNDDVMDDAGSNVLDDDDGSGEIEDDADVTEAGPTESLPSGTMVMCDDGVERPVITREQAIADGTNRYFTGIACRNGHMVERKVKGYVCTTCSRNRQKLRKKARVASDPDFKKKVALKRAEKHKAKYAADPDYRQKVLDRAKARRVRNASAKRLAKAESEIVKPAAE